MIIKSYELNKINFDQNKLILFYGKNEGLKNDSTNNLLKNKENISKYEEKEILENTNIFLENVFCKSLFENEKIIIIKRVTDKILKIIEEIEEKKIEDLKIIINADILEKKSKLRSFFEKSREHVCVAFYPDTNQVLSKLTYNFFNQKKISISPANINLIVNKCNGDRETLFNELDKIEYFSKSGKKITEESIIKLTNLIENHSISDLIDNCLAKNKKKIINILNENNFGNEDCIIITRTFLLKSKKILKLCSEFKSNKNIDLTISSAKPPIFWKDKEITKQQIYKWTPENIKKLIYKLNEIELLIKKNINNSINLITDFILDQSSSNTNS
ncbi:DNA-directed DNA polymerase III [Candidatus Pelagibacter sp. HTCC7211]|uniref:DNA polymerase III subunit delta n=1 Tax=Pelagibacter sp. (strain HTCC7211) TaxID=439493 RepID=UPI00018393EE|nr:DNA-directed DNA polymerase III subunit delta [Candidatus Pelagibacter sp. HTCC7211]EDZ60859.1 DNA-directed DNA polymerase III [Candidatus Pelagibacter sp. HTCC7211]MBD1151454.1 DNA polymerase III subunit delta [Pelagibacterales bacterium SAG-MED25]